MVEIFFENPDHCIYCPKGTYSNGSESGCTPCPNGLDTIGRGETSVGYCSKLYQTYNNKEINNECKLLFLTLP